MKIDKDSGPFLDTTFLLPFFQVNVKIEEFTPKSFRTFLMRLSEVHFSELSIYEAKAKIYRLSRRDAALGKALEAFGANLATLRTDERITFHPYTERDDKYFNMIASKALRLDSFDTVILAQAMSVGTLITEDSEILRVRREETFQNDPVLGKTRIRRWKELELSG